MSEQPEGLALHISIRAMGGFCSFQTVLLEWTVTSGVYK